MFRRSNQDIEGDDMSDSEFEASGIAIQTAALETEFTDVTFLCIDCDQDFLWSAGEQAFFKDKNLKNPPKRCKECKKAKNERIASIIAAQESGIRQRIEVQVKCARCTMGTTVPFYPSQGRPVYCRSCFLEMNPAILNGSSE
jgi:CxxC-x17-CxxC domain-containing protein